MEARSIFSKLGRLITPSFKSYGWAEAPGRSCPMRSFVLTMLLAGIVLPYTAQSGQLVIRANATGNVYKNWLGNWQHGTEFWTGVNGTTPDELAWVQFPLSSSDRDIIHNRKITGVYMLVYMTAVSSESGYMYVSDLKGTDLGDGIQYSGPPSGWGESILATDIRYMYPSSTPYFNTFSIANVPVNPYLALQDGDIYLNRYANSGQSRVVFGIWSDKDVRFYKHTSADYAPVLTINHRPNAPTSVSASDGDYTNEVSVTWNASSGATAYEVWRHTSNNSGSATKIGDPTSNGYNDTTAVAGTTYYYWVKAVDSENTKSLFSSSDSGYLKCARPTGVSASDGTYSDKVRVTWNPSSGATSYEVWRINPDNTVPKIADPTGTSYDDTTAVAGTTYYYGVKAKYAGTTSDFSSWDSGYRQIAPPAAPTGVSATDGTYSDKVAVTWNASSGATAYEVWRHTSNSSGSASKIADPTGTSYDDTSAVAGTTYYYWVKAKNAGGTSGFSSSDSGYRQSTPSEVLPGSGGMLRILSSGATRFVAFKSDGSVVWSNSSVGGAGRIQISSSINPQWTDAHIFSYTGSVMSTHLGTNP